MAGLPPGDPQLVSMIVNHLKTQGLFDQFRRECLADVDTKPAYLNLKQRVDNFVSNHLSNHTWSPHLNKNQLRNNIRQLVLQSGMLEQGVDRIVAQVVDPKINHSFRPQVERVVHQFLSPGSCSEEPPAPLPPIEVKPDSSIPEQATPPAPTTTTTTTTTAAATRGDAMSILETISSLNQEASVRASSSTDRGQSVFDDPMQLEEEGEQDMSIVEEGDDLHDGKILEEAEELKLVSEVQALDVKMEEPQDEMELGKERYTEEIKMEEDDAAAQDQAEEEKVPSKTTGKHSEEKQDEDLLKSTSQAKQKARERIKEEYSLEDSDLDGLSDITVSSVHTSDLSSFEEESDAEEQPSDSSEEGELTTDGEKSEKREASGDTGEEDKESKPRRKAYVHKPFLYSRYYSDSDDEITVEERRRSAAKDKEERLLKRQQNRERMEEKRKQKAAQTEEQDQKKQKSGDPAGLERPRAIEARKERKVLEKKMALNRKRKLDSRKEGDVSRKKKGDTGEGSKKAEVKPVPSRIPQQKLMRNLSESASSDERHRRMSGSISEDSSETKKLCDKGRTHSFILELEQGAQEALKQRSIGKFDRVSRKDFHLKDRKDKERSISDERAKLKQKQEKKSEHQVDESQERAPSEDKGEKKPKVKSEKKIMGLMGKDQKASVPESITDEASKDAKKLKPLLMETTKTEKDKEREKDKTRDKDKDKVKEKEKVKSEKASAKIEAKLLLRPDSAGSSEDRSDMEPGLDGSKRKDKHVKELLKRSKSHTEDRPGDKPKSKSEGNEKEKLKSDHENQKPSKSTSELEKDPKKAKPVEKGKIPEKSVKSKTPQLTKMEKKAPGADARAATGAPEAAKEKRKEASVKEQRRPSEDLQHDKCEMKSVKKKLDKKDKERKDGIQEERKAPREAERPDKLPKSHVSPPSNEPDEQQRKPPPPLRDTSTDSEPVTTTAAAAAASSFSDDTCDALSDITPEPSEGETEMPLAPAEAGDAPAPALPMEADALLTLMDVCAAADTRLPVESVPEAVAPETALQDADMKMKEAALTLLSMDPDSAVSSSFISPEPEVVAAPPVFMEAQVPPPPPPPAAEEEEVGELQPPTDAQMVAEPSPGASQQSVEPAGEEANSAANEPVTLQSEMDIESTGFIIPQEADSTSSECPAPSNEEEAAEIAMETQPEEEPAPPADTDAAVVLEAADVKEDVEEAAAPFPAVAAEQAPKASAEQAAEISSPEAADIPNEQEQTELDAAGPEVCPETEEVPAEDTQAEVDTDNGEVEIKNEQEQEKEQEQKQEQDTAAEETEPQSVSADADAQVEAAAAPETTEEIGERESLSQPTPERQPRHVSSSDSQDDEKLSDVSENQGKPRRGRPKRKLSSQSVAEGKEFGDDTDEKRIKRQPSEEEGEEQQIVEIKTPRRGRSSRTGDETENDQAKQPEKLEETPSRRGRRSAVRETLADAQKSEESKDEACAEKPPADDLENPQKAEEENGSKATEAEVSPSIVSHPAPEDGDTAEGSDPKDHIGTDETATEEKKSEEMEESAEESQAGEEVKEGPGQQEQSEQQMEEDNRTESQSEGQEDAKLEGSGEKKPDNEEAEQQQEDQATTPKKPGRRGRPPKAAVAAAAAAAAAVAAAAAEDSDKKPEEQNDEEEEDGGEEGKETATRATTRAASRLEAEKNKPSKPSTRASRQNGKDETAAGTRGTRGQAAAAAAAAKGGRKREPSPPAVRTRGGQKSEEPPSKRAKR